MLNATLRSLRAHTSRLAMTGIAVVLGVALMAGTLVLTDTVGRTFNDLFAQVNAGTDAVVRSTDVVESPFGEDQRGPLPTDVLPVVQATPGVAEAVPAVAGFAQIVGPDGKVVGNPGGGAPSFAFSWTDVEGLNPFRVAEGSAPATDDAVAIDRKSATDGGITVGDTITLLSTTEPRQFTVSGIVTFGELDSPAGATVALLTLPATQALVGQTDSYTEIGIVATDGTSQQQVVDALAERLPSGTEAITGDQRTEEDQSSVASALGFFNAFLLAFAIVALVVGAFIINNTFSIVLAQRTRELALLRAVGASRRQVTVSVIGEAAVVGVVASVIGLALGVVAAIGLRSLLAVTGFEVPATSLSVSAGTALVSVGAGSVVTIAASILPAIRASRVPPMAALRDVAVESRPPFLRAAIGIVILAFGALNIGAGLVSAGAQAVGIGAVFVFIAVAVLAPVFARPVVRFLAAPLPRLRGVAGTLARENAGRNPRRTATTASALMIGVALVGFIAIFAASTKASIERIVDDSFTGDLIIDTGQFVTGGVSPNLAESVASAPGVAAASGIRVVPATLNLPDSAAPAGPAGGFLLAADTRVLGAITDPQVVEGRVDDLGVDEIAIAAEAASGSSLAVGDQVTADFTTGSRTLAIVGTYDNRVLLGDYLVDLATADVTTVDRLDTQVWVKVAADADVATVKQELERLAEPWPNAEVQDLAQFKESQASQLDQLLTLVYALLGLAVFIALVGIANTLALSVFERTRELGLLRAVGMSRTQLRSVVRWESVIIAVFGTLLGLVIGVVFGWLLYLSLADQGLGDFRVPFTTLAAVVVLAGLAGVAAAALPARRAGRLDVLAAIDGG